VYYVECTGGELGVGTDCGNIERREVPTVLLRISSDNTRVRANAEVNVRP